MKNRKSRNRYSSDTPKYPHRFFVAAESFADRQVTLTHQHAHQICSVLRLKTGDHIITLDNQGAEYDIELTAVAQDQVKGHIVDKREATGEPQVQITLYQSLLARQKYEWALQKCTEVGVSRFVPLITHRSLVRRRADVKQEKLARWRRIITEAAEQSHRARIPELTSPLDLDKALHQLAEFDLALIASPDDRANSLRDCLTQCPKVSSIALLIGPEGGFAEDEVQRCRANGAIAFSMGPRILRTETAAVVASSLILYELGEMNI
ncbi:MAG: 16S rRNA (uracil(1498)-N(3))-methyltransferase [Planctomycetota bacterium]|jgi:16S rRNA (uracil1498-N3)-methyltransferase